MNIEQCIKNWQLEYHTLHDCEVIGISALAYHATVLVNVDPNGYEERYCYHNQDIALEAIEHFKAHGEWKWYKKYHTKGISVVGKYAYAPGVLHLPENALYEVDWDCNELALKYPYSSPVQLLKT